MTLFLMAWKGSLRRKDYAALRLMLYRHSVGRVPVYPGRSPGQLKAWFG